MNLKLTDAQCIELHRRWEQRVTRKSLAIEFGLSVNTISSAINERGRRLVKKMRTAK